MSLAADSEDLLMDNYFECFINGDVGFPEGSIPFDDLWLMHILVVKVLLNKAQDVVPR